GFTPATRLGPAATCSTGSCPSLVSTATSSPPPSCPPNRAIASRPIGGTPPGSPAATGRVILRRCGFPTPPMRPSGISSARARPLSRTSSAPATPSANCSCGVASVHRGAITKTGNAHLRRVLVEAAWAYRFPPRCGKALRTRQRGQPDTITAIAWKAQHRLNTRYRRLLGRGKPTAQVVTAVARELVGFIWAIGVATERASTAAAPNFASPTQNFLSLGITEPPRSLVRSAPLIAPAGSESLARPRERGPGGAAWSR